MMKSLCFISFLIALSVSHLCIYSPEQRGGWAVGGAQPGDNKCFQPKGPCGNVAPGKPQRSVLGGTSMAVSFQQNLNHYNPGWPGLLDVSYAPGPNPVESDFKVLGVVQDYWPHLQATQTNFTMVVTLPNIDCPNCVLRVRYNPNKPTEPVFHNCADFSIAKTSGFPGKKIYAFEQWHPNYGYMNLVELAYSGEVISYANMQMRGTMDDTEPFVANGLVTAVTDKLWFVGDLMSNFLAGKAPRNLYSFDLNAKKTTLVRTLDGTDMGTGVQMSALIPTGDSRNPLLAVQQFKKVNYDYGYKVKFVSSNGIFSEEIVTTEAESTFVNYFWSTYDAQRNKTYILSGDENSLEELKVVLHTADLTLKTIRTVSVDHTAFTIATIHVDPISGTIFGVSPGLFGQNNWSIVKIDPLTGNVSLSSQIKTRDEFTFNFAGGVYNGLNSENGILITHVFRKVIDGTSVLAVINANTGDIVYSTAINSDVDNLASFQSIVM